MPAVDEQVPIRVQERVLSLEGSIRLLAHSIETSAKHTAELVAGMREDMREVRKSMDSIREEQAQIRAHSQGLERLGKQIEQLTSDFRDHTTEDRKVADSVTKFKGGLVAVWAVFGVLATISTAYINERFNNASSARSNLETRLTKVEGKLP